MSIRAVICDVYGTLLAVGPPPPEGGARWEALWRAHLSAPPRLALEAFSAACDRIIAREHAAARARGIPFPEIHWPTVVLEVVPELAGLPAAELEEFLYRQAQLGHTLALMAGAAEALRAFAERDLVLGIASNAQSYTVRELDVALAEAGLSLGRFDPRLCFWSFEHGFSKPDPHVFRTLGIRLKARGIDPEETLMVGDRLDNDVTPARAQGWRAWHLTAARPVTGAAGGWRALSRHLPRLGSDPEI